MRRHPDGFVRLREDNCEADRIKREINKWLRKLLPANAKLEDGDDADKEGTSAYCLRHTFIKRPNIALNRPVAIKTPTSGPAKEKPPEGGS